MMVEQREQVWLEQLKVDFFVLFSFFETGFLCVALAVLELALVDQAGLELTEICLPLPSKGWD